MLSKAELEERVKARADLSGANLSGANLSRADLSGTYLTHANLSDATLPRGYKLLSIGPVGSRRDYITVYHYDGIQLIRTGCFSGNLDKFISAVAAKPVGDVYRIQYETIVIPMLRLWFAQIEGGES